MKIQVQISIGEYLSALRDIHFEATAIDHKSWPIHMSIHLRLLSKSPSRDYVLQSFMHSYVNNKI